VFDRSRVTPLRHCVAARASAAGLTGAVVCEVSDEGAGLEAVHPQRPAPDQPGGWGLWLVRELTDTCEIRTGPTGTAVRISSRTGLPS
jgi:serine/threonine-protein kinase RsbW